MELQDMTAAAAPLKAGWLVKQTTRVNLFTRQPISHRRFFTLLEGPPAQLSWFTSEKKATSTTTTTTKQVILEPSSCCLGLREDGSDLVFELWVPAKERRYVLRAATPEGRTGWVNALKAFLSPPAALALPPPTLPAVVAANAEEVEEMKDEMKEEASNSRNGKPSSVPIQPPAFHPYEDGNEEEEEKEPGPVPTPPASTTVAPAPAPVPLPRAAAFPATATNITTSTTTTTTPRADANLPALEHQLGRAMAVIAEMKGEIERLQAAAAQAHDSRALAAQVCSLKEQLSAEHFQLTKLGFEKQAADTKHARRIEELEEEVRQYKGEVHAQGESNDSLMRQLQRGHGELLATRTLLGLGSQDRLEEKVRERLQALQNQVAQLQAAHALQKQRLEAQAQEHAAALQETVAKANASKTAREIALDAEVRRLEQALTKARQEAVELQETSTGLQDVWRVQQEQLQHQQQTQAHDAATETEGLTELVGHITALLGQLEQQAHAAQGCGNGGSIGTSGRSPSSSMFSEEDDEEKSEGSSRLIQPEELVAHDDLSELADVGAEAQEAEIRAREMDHSQQMVQQLASGAIEMAEVLAQRSKDFEVALEQARREKLFHEARAMYAAQHCMRLREMTQAVSAKAAGFVAHAEALISARSNFTTDSTGSKHMTFDMPMASDAEVLAALKATKTELEQALHAQYEAHILLENELRVEAGSHSNSVRTAMEILPPVDSSSTSTTSTTSSAMPILPSPLPLPPKAAMYHAVPNAAALQEEEAKLKRQRRKLAEERKRSEALSAHLSMQKRSIDEQMVMLSEQVAHSRQYLERRKAELEARGAAAIRLPVMTTTPVPRTLRPSSAPPLEPLDPSSLSLLKKKKKGDQAKQQQRAADAEMRNNERRSRSRSSSSSFREMWFTADNKGGVGELAMARHARTSSASSASVFTSKVTTTGTSGTSSGTSGGSSPRFSFKGKRTSGKEEERLVVDTSDMIRVNKEIARLEQSLNAEKSAHQQQQYDF